MPKIIKLFDRLEDKIRGLLSRHPILYAFIGGVGMTLFWRGVWHTADMFSFMTGPVSLIISMVILLLTGLLVSVFIGHHIILTGIRQEKKIEEKTEAEIKNEENILHEIRGRLAKIEQDVQLLNGVKSKRTPKTKSK